MNTLYEGIKETVKVSSDEVGPCKICSESLSGDDLELAINHYIQKHKYLLLHVGTQTSYDYKGKIYNATVAILGLK